MRKLLLTSTSVVAVAFASQAFAAGSSTNLLQTGANHQATIDQTGAAGGQVGVVGGWAFTQENGTGAGGNVISITQTNQGNKVGVNTQSWQSGTENAANIVQSSNPAAPPAVLSATNNQISLQQTGYKNSTDIKQINSGGYVEPTNNVNVVQLGALNIVSASQNGQAATTTVTQWNNNNRLYSDQHTHSQATVLQWNDGGNGSGANTIYNTQFGGTAAKLNVALQYGHDNTIYNTQAPNSLLDVTQQSGSFLIIDSVQNGATSKEGNKAYVTSQDGTNSRIINRQSGTQQYNNNNTVTFLQSGGDQLASNTQTGRYNNATFYQSGTVNQAYLLQSGDSNTATATQLNYNSYASLSQTGSSNNVVSWQNGTGNQNISYVTQSSNGNTATASQNGSGNISNIKQ